MAGTAYSSSAAVFNRASLPVADLRRSPAGGVPVEQPLQRQSRPTGRWERWKVKLAEGIVAARLPTTTWRS